MQKTNMKDTLSQIESKKINSDVINLRQRLFPWPYLAKYYQHFLGEEKLKDYTKSPDL